MSYLIHQMKRTLQFIVIFCLINVKAITLTYGQSASFRDVIINEIMANPNPSIAGLPQVEYLELYNRSTKTIDLSGWTFKDATSTLAIFPSGSLSPGAYVIICKSSDAASFLAYGQVIGTTKWPSLNNDKDSVVIRDAGDNLIDALYYRDTWYQDAAKKNGGYALELINPSLSCSGAENWKASVSPLGGTPGAKNSVEDDTPDIDGPIVTGAEIEDSDKVKITFSEAVDLVTAVNPGLYNFFPTLPVSSVYFDTDRKTAHLILQSNIVKGQAYQLQIIGISDCEGNSMNDTLVTLLLGEKVKFNELVISEIMADPTPPVQLPEQEYIEIYNRSNRVLDLKGLTFTAGTRTATFTSGTLAPGAYGLVTSIDVANQFSMATNVFGLSGFPTITNSGADLILKNNEGELVFQISFSDAWYQTSSKKDGGWSLEMVDLSQPCAGGMNWKESIDPKGGTPGMENSVKGIIQATIFKPVGVELVSSKDIRVILSGKMDISQINNIRAEISPTLEIDTILPDLSTAAKLEIIFKNDIPQDQIFNLNLNGLYDCNGSEIADTILQFGVPEQPEAGDIVINELLYDPKTGGQDFVELLNVSDKLLTLSDMIITRDDLLTGGAITTVPLQGYNRLIFPGDYLVLSASGESVRAQYKNPGAQVFVDITGFPSYVIDGGIVSLYRKDNLLLDQLKYDPKMHFKLLRNTKGVSLERVNPKVSAAERSNWNSAALSVGGATPGYRNSQFLQPQVKGELNISPEVFSPDNDGIDDLLGVNYQLDNTDYVGSASVYTAEGIPVRKLFKNQTLAQSGFFTWDGLDDQDKKARVGIYVVVLEIFDLKGNKDILRAKCVVAQKDR